MAADMTIFLEKLPEREEKRLAELEGIVKKNMKSFYAVAFALVEIRDNRLHRGTHWTFESYVKDNFGVTKTTANRYIAASEVILNIAPGIDLLDNDSHSLTPIGVKSESTMVDKTLHLDSNIIDQFPSESQLRPLTKLKAEEQKTVWQKANETAPDGKLTAKHIQKTIFDLLGTPEKKMAANRRHVLDSKRIADTFREAYSSFLLQVEKARFEKYKNTSWEEVMLHLDGLREIIAEDGSRMMPDMVPQMEKKDRQKLLAAGFRIFRLDTVRGLIEEQQTDGRWAVHQTFEANDPTIAYAFDELMVNEKHLRG